MRVKTLAFITLILIAALSASAQGRRVALVLGNSAYQKIQALNNSSNDAVDMAAALKRLGYDVLSSVNLDRKAMRSMIEDFNTRIRGADVALFFYSGHGVQLEGENYLVPVNAEVSVAGDVAEECVSLSRVTARMNEAGAKTNVIILDACRDNPFKAVSRGLERGLAVVGQKPPESIIVYATSENEKAADGTGRNGVFTKALLANLARQESFMDLLLDVSAQVRSETGDRQKPAVYQNLTHRVFLAGERPAAAAAPAAASAAPAAALPPPAAAASPTFSVIRPTGSLSVSAATAGTLYLDGVAIGALPAGARAKLDSVEVGERSLELRYADGQVESKKAKVAEGKATEIAFRFQKASSGMIAWYKFDETEGQVASDSSGNGRDGTVVSGSWVPGKLGGALKLDGNGQYVRLPAGLTSLMKSFTISFWIKPAMQTAWTRAFDFGTDSSSYITFSTATKSNGLRFAITKGSWQGEQLIDSRRILLTTRWTHIAITLGGGKSVLYLDGKEEFHNNAITLDPTSIDSRNDYLGRSQYAVDPYLNGLLDDFRIYDRALSAEEVAALYAGAK